MFHVKQNVEMNIQSNKSSGNNSSMVYCDILRDVYQMLIDTKVLNTSYSDKIVNFKFPDELMVKIIINFVF